eukprot:CAMPEP_0198730902 /NCGR_PEP_ID=MMETSP1475-20131203/27054_1 /TAXON_ID= ORGANISM="Unidentified sp., Strain CCMP1999" /NCGR_SAMPLE_ID=MMETSP1475 /ASSEMBLY_ACC=CAM_ASM_001111 /LENGTH=91 /DNA_ID=CAMNT_0044493791 /DNA_START=103 /DNA_END=378 /DNA_ORIENTATION=+
MRARGGDGPLCGADLHPGFALVASVRATVPPAPLVVKPAREPQTSMMMAASEDPCNLRNCVDHDVERSTDCGQGSWSSGNLEPPPTSSSRD